MKKLITVSLFIFGVTVMTILVAGLVFYQNKKDNQVLNSQTNNLTQETINQIKFSGGSLVLNMQEISKHNKSSDCWMLINSKVYNITSYFGSHPGGSSTMTPSCGKDATSAYMTKDPYASSNSRRSSHSSRALGILNNYYIGNLNQTISGQAVTQTNSVVAPVINGGGRYEDD